MAHEVETMAWTNEKPWHGLGVEVQPNITTTEMLKAAGLDWNVDLEPLMYRRGDVFSEVGHKALVRSTDGRLLDVVGADWKPVQNADALDFFHEFVEAGHMTMETAGSLKQGRHVFALAKIGEDFSVVRGDKINGYLLFSNPHQYGRAPSILLTMVRVVCNNTLTLALGHGGKARYSWSHLQTFDGDRAEMAKEALGLASATMKETKAQMQLLAKAKLGMYEAEEYFVRVFDPKNTQGDKGKVARHVPLAIEAMAQQPGANLGEGTYWQAFNAVTYLTDHTLGRSQDTRVSSALFGGYAALKQRAFDLAVERAKVAA
jgi:phage/plasmid-like protein (TIGR03299 family)